MLPVGELVSRTRVSQAAEVAGGLAEQLPVVPGRGRDRATPDGIAGLVGQALRQFLQHLDLDFVTRCSE